MGSGDQEASCDSAPSGDPVPTDEPVEAPAPPSANESWRLFIAIELPAEIREAIADLQSRLRKAFQFTSCAPAWVAPESMHLTLRFLGEVPAELVPLVAEGLQPIAAATEAPRLRAMGLGVFPDWKSPRVLWMGMRDKNDRLRPLQRSIEDQARALGFEPDPKPYRPHLTLARFRSLKGTHTVKGIAASHDSFRTELFTPDSVALMRSQAGEGGARYTALAHAPFAPASPPVSEPGVSEDQG
jgi:2'-5' RNA ligase